MRRTFIIITLIAIAVVGISIGIDAQVDVKSQHNSQHNAQRQARQQQRAQRMAEYEKYIDSLVLSHNYRFMPQTMQQLPAGIMRNLQNPCYEVVVSDSDVDICIPYLKGYTPPYYPVVFNYVLPSVMHYTAEQMDNGWHITFETTLFSATTYTFSFDIYSHYGDVTLTISSPFYNSVQYTGNIVGI